VISLDQRPAANDNVGWTPFEEDGVALEYITFPSRVGPVRPRGWPAHRAAPGRWKDCVTLLVQGRGAGGVEAAELFPDGVGQDFPCGVPITVEDAIALVRMMLDYRDR
jgi:hypothetical protein